MAKVAIASSVLNQTELLKGMIASLTAQTFTDWHLFLVDDGSTEDIAAVCKDEPRITLERFPLNRGVPHGINVALNMALDSGAEYIGVLSADEHVWNEKLAVQVEYLDSHPKIGAVWGLPQQGPLGQRPEFEQYALRAHNRSREAWRRTLLNLENVPIGGASMLMRAECIKNIGLFSPDHFTTSDLEWFVRFFENYQGWILPYRFAIEAERTDTPLRKTVTKEQFDEDMGRVRSKHQARPPKVLKDVTIGIPVRNMAQTIAATLNSIINQTWPHWRIMVLDDASTDNTVDIVRSFGRPDRIQVLQFDENRGCNEAQNQMLARCETPFFVVLAADDILDPTFIETCISEFTQDPWLEFVASQTDFIDVEGKTVEGPHQLKDIRKAANMSRAQWLQLLYSGNVYFGAGMYRTKAALEVGGWDSTCEVLADYDMYLKLLQRENIKIIERPLTHTRIHDGQRSVYRGPDPQKWQQDLRKQYHRIKLRYYPPQPKVIIATSFYEMKAFSPYVSSMVETVRLLTQLGIPFEFWELSGDSYVERAKNTMMNRFLEEPEATHLFMIDSDMQWNAEAFVRMLAIDEEIIVGSYPQKNGWHKWTSIPEVVVEGEKTHPVGKVFPNGMTIFKAQYLAGGFVCFKRRALEKFRDAYPELKYMDSGADPKNPNRVYTEFCACEMGKFNEEDPYPVRWGEDRVMGKRFSKIGIDAWIYPNVDFGHYGIRGWMGNYEKFLQMPKEERENRDTGNTVRLNS